MAENFITRLKQRKKELASHEDEKPSIFQQQLAKFKFDPDHINAFQAVSYTHLTLPTIYSV